MTARDVVRCGFAAQVLAATVLLSPVPGWASDVKVIANPGIKGETISPGELRRVFLLETASLSEGTRVEPVLQKNGPSHEAFLREFLETDNQSLSEYYGTMIFTGKAAMPKEFASEAEVLAYVAKTKGAIGYVSAAADTSGVKVLVVTDSRTIAARTLVRQVQPEYPETLRRLGIGGTVRLRVTISSDGTVKEVELLGGNPVLAESAIAAVKQWVYSPGQTRTTMEVSIPFGDRQ
jgi:TonB family protein